MRIVRTLRELGIASVAVYSEADAECAARPARRRGRAASGPGTVGKSYLDIDAILEAAAVDAARRPIHPGYGFLAENADFARACASAGLRVHRAAARGDREHGRQDDRAAPDGRGRACRSCRARWTPLGSAEEALATARAIGYPVAFKAAGGGGGKGMRVARAEEEARAGVRAGRDARASASSRTPTSTSSATSRIRGTSRCRSSRDAHGNVVHLGERDCSIQRRHQKLVEESPGPSVIAGAARAHLRDRRGGRARRRLPRRRHRRVPARGRAATSSSR